MVATNIDAPEIVNVKRSSASDAIAGAYVVGNLVVYGATLAIAVSDLHMLLRLVASIFHGFALIAFYIMGHECVHRSFFRTRRVNDWVGRFVYGFNWHSVSLWRQIHNINHHGKTNLKGVDDVWAPFSPEEFRTLPKWRQTLERVFRGPLGHLCYYQLQYTFTKAIFPIWKDVRPHWRKHMRETAFVFVFGAALIAATLATKAAVNPSGSFWAAALFSTVLPFMIWNGFVSFAIYIQHTHPLVHWYDDLEKWTFHKGQIQGTTDTVIPIRLYPLFDEVIRHTAHHVNPMTPIYRLVEAQEALLKQHADIVYWRMNWEEYWRTVRSCKLYDYDRQCWTDFDGVKTSLTLDEVSTAQTNPFRAKIVGEPQASVA
ncbi:MAG: fatty acid desaturase [Pseudomonadota bacterium]